MSDAGERLVDRAETLAHRIHKLQDAAKRWVTEPNEWAAKQLAEAAIRFSEEIRLLQHRVGIK